MILPKEYNAHLKRCVKHKDTALLLVGSLGIIVATGLLVVTIPVMRDKNSNGILKLSDIGAIAIFACMLFITVTMVIVAIMSLIAIRKSKTEYKCQCFALKSKELLRSADDGNISGYILYFENNKGKEIKAEPYSGSVWYWAKPNDKFYIVTIGFINYAFEVKDI